MNKDRIQPVAIANSSSYSDAEADEKALLINDEHKKEHHHHHKIYYEIFLVVMPVFSGYACLFALQRKLKQKYGISDDGSELSHLYGVAASLVYMGNLFLRLGHNIVFCYLSPRMRVIASIVSMGLSMLTISCIFFLMDHPSLFWVFLAYGLGGVGIGTFESNLLSTITPLGKKTKLWAIIGIPSGILLITVGAFILTENGVPPGYIYFTVMIFNFIALGIFLIRIYRDAGEGNAVTLTQFLHELKEWRQWLPHIKWHSIALTLDMFFVSLFSPGVLLYIYDGKSVAWTWTDKSIESDWLFAIYDACFFLGDTLSRRIFYPIKIVFPLMFWGVSILGGFLGLLHISYFVPLCGFLVAFANGSIYAQANRQIDTHVSEKYSLIAFSFWLFLGDIGSVTGSNIISYLAVAAKKYYH